MYMVEVKAVIAIVEEVVIVEISNAGGGDSDGRGT